MTGAQVTVYCVYMLLIYGLFFEMWNCRLQASSVGRTNMEYGTRHPRFGAHGETSDALTVVTIQIAMTVARDRARRR